MTSNAKSVSLIMNCSSWMAYADSNTGTIAAVAPQPGSPVRLSSAYPVTPIARPIRCCTATTAVKLWRGSSSHNMTE